MMVKEGSGTSVTIIEDFEKIDSLFQQTNSLKPHVPTVNLEKIIINLEDEVFLETVRFGNDDFAVIAGYGDVVIRSMTIKKVYYVEDLLTGDRSSNLYTIALNDIALNSSACLLAKASSSQSWLWHQRLSHLNFATINNFVKNNLVRGLPKMKFEKEHLCSACEQGKIHRKHHKSKTAFASNKPLYLLHMDLCGPMRVEKQTLAKFFDEVEITQQFSAARPPQQNGVVERRNRTLVKAARTMFTFANLPLFLWAEAIVTTCFTQNRSIIHKRSDKTPYEPISKRKPNIKFFHVFGCRCYLLNGYDVFRKLKMASKQLSLEPGLSNLNETGKSSNPTLSKVLESSKKDLEDLFHDFYDEYFDASKITKSPTTNVETSNEEISPSEEEVFHETSESFQEDSASSSLNNDVQQSSEEVEVPSSNTQSISNNMVPKDF
ncbi:gag-pol polyprotein [Tanacetum coccineum]|uniref:Gag-pol polyprotein n=1 Tax=Tanacetum coccineum TaxID=301880 RepID=A0ABQ4ZMV8_9ASTR